MMRAVWNGVVLAEAPRTVRVEGNHYFPPESLRREFLLAARLPYCLALRGPLRRSGLPVREINIWEDPRAAAWVRSVADGNQTVPTVFVGTHAMVNPSMGQVLAAVREHAPDLAARTVPVEPAVPRWQPVPAALLAVLGAALGWWQARRGSRSTISR